MVPASAHTTDPSHPAWRRIGRYELGPRLAAGGMAELYVARATGVHGFQKYVAIKRILPQWAGDREFVEMFLDEARLAAQLDHPNVVHVHDIGEDDDGPFFTMDYIHGQSLLAIVRRLRARGSTLPWAAFVALASAAAAGLHHAHERRGFDGKPLGIIHRDVSPTNILVTYEGAVKIVDFGIAKASTSRHATRPSVRKGKMAYMSPEQCRGDVLDRRSDVFALGVVLYELCTLSRAFQGEGEFAVMNQIVNHDLPPPSSRRADVPAALDRILLRALARDPDARYGSARELLRELDAFAAREGLVATPEALAVVMEALFGASPYPWEGTELEPGSDAGPGSAAPPTEPTEATPTTARPMSDTKATRVKAPAETDAGRVKPEPARVEPRPAARAGRRRAWVIGMVGAGALASIAWMAVPRGEAASPGATVPTGVVLDAPASTVDAGADAAPPSAAGRLPAAAAPITQSSTPPLTEPTTAEPTPTASHSTPKPERRSSKPARPRTTSTTRADAPPPSSTLPAPFDPDAPAPRVR